MSEILKFRYRNHRGEVELREVRPERIRFASTEWYPEKQWHLYAFCLDRQALRWFALKNIMTLEPDVRLQAAVHAMIGFTDLKAGTVITPEYVERLQNHYVPQLLSALPEELSNALPS
jgi:hypothetical protein